MGRVLILVLLALNILALAVGLALEYWRSQPRSLPAFNADKIRVLGIGHEAGAPRPRQEGAAGPEPAVTPPSPPPNP